MPRDATVPELVSQRLESFVADQRAAAGRESAGTAPLIDAAAAAVAGGKRLRAQFCCIGAAAVSASAAAEPTPAVIGVASALELFQAAALVHDDLIDNSDTRRGGPAAHRRLEAAHREHGWSGNAEAFGRSAAILLGDLLVAWSDDLLEQSIADLSTQRQVRNAYAVMRSDVTLGQFLDVAQESAWSSQPQSEHAAKALEIVSLKSARYSVQQPLVIGAACAGGDARQVDALRAFGLPIGMAYQLRDDVLGVFGDATETGKPVGDDLREGKRTLLVAYAREALPANGRAVFDELLGDEDLEPGQITMLQQTIIDTGALARVEAAISAYAAEADVALRGAPLAHRSVSELRDLATMATTRSA